MKTLLTISAIIWLCTGTLHAQKIKPCDTWLSEFIQVEPKIADGTPIDKYVTRKLIDESSLKSMATCMVGLKVYVNCNGELSYEEQDYRNNPLLKSECAALLHKTETIIKGVKQFSPGTICHQAKDFTFKLVVKVKGNGEPVTEILY